MTAEIHVRNGDFEVGKKVLKKSYSVCYIEDRPARFTYRMDEE